MRRPRLYPPIENLVALRGEVLIGIGLAVLIAAMIVPGVPAVTAMAVVALGATRVTLAHHAGTAVLVPTLLLHLMIYTMMYALFVGATLHAASAATGEITLLQSVDLAASLAPIAAAGRSAWAAIVEHGLGNS